MRKKTVQLVTIILLISIVLFIPSTIKAAKGLTVSVSNKNPEVGNTFTLTVGSGVGGRISMKSSNPSVVRNSKYKIRFRNIYINRKICWNDYNNSYSCRLGNNRPSTSRSYW